MRVVFLFSLSLLAAAQLPGCNSEDTTEALGHERDTHGDAQANGAEAGAVDPSRDPSGPSNDEAQNNQAQDDPSSVDASVAAPSDRPGDRGESQAGTALDAAAEPGDATLATDSTDGTQSRDAAAVPDAAFDEVTNAPSDPCAPRSEASSSDACIPLPCELIDAQCGPVSDGCGSFYDFGQCKDGQRCGLLEPNVCADSPLCEAPSFEELCVGRECGQIGDGCGEVVNCGECAPGEVCGLEQPYQCDRSQPQAATDGGAAPNPCEPEPVCDSVECGLFNNGCGEAVDCGPCPEGQVCGLFEPGRCTALAR